MFFYAWVLSWEFKLTSKKATGFSSGARINDEVLPETIIIST